MNELMKSHKSACACPTTCRNSGQSMKVQLRGINRSANWHDSASYDGTNDTKLNSGISPDEDTSPTKFRRQHY